MTATSTTSRNRQAKRIVAMAAAIAVTGAGGAMAQVTQAPPNDPTMAPWLTAPSTDGTAAPAGAPAGAPPTTTAQPTRQGITQPAGPNTPQAGAAAAPATADHFAGGPTADEPDGTESLGLVQGAWSNPRAHMGPGQSSPGVKIFNWSPAASPAIVNMRAQMLTQVVMPADDEIVRIVFNDTSTFTGLISPDRRSVSLKAKNAGVDGNAVINSKSGNIYTLYLRTTSYRSDRIPDVNVLIRAGMGHADDETSGGTGATGLGAGTANTGANGMPVSADERAARAYSGAAYDDDPTARLTMRPRALMTRPGQDYSARGLTGAGRLRTDLAIKVSRPEDSIIAPVAAWRTDRFTYLDFGPRAASMNTWPASTLVIDGVEAPIGSRVSGANRSVMIVEGIGNVTLRSGTHVVCITTKLIDNDPRHPEIDEPFRNRTRPGDRAVDVLAPSDVASPPMRGPSPRDYGAPVAQADPAVGTAAVATAMPPPVAPIAPMQQVVRPPMARASGLPGTRIVSGPYDGTSATKTAFDIRDGLDGNAPAMAAVVARAGGGSNVQAAAESSAAAETLCESVRRAGHACKTY